MSEDKDSQMLTSEIKYSELEEAVRKLSSASEEQFEIIKHEKWYTRLWDTVTFSKKGEIRLAGQIGTLSQTQQIVAQYLLKTSQQNKDISDLVNNNASYIKKLAGQSISFKRELTSVSNLMLLLNEINNEQYNGFRSITAMCLILSQLDNEVLSDRRALNNILLSLNNHHVLSGEIIETIDFLMDVANMTEKEVPLVYTELSSISNNYYANIVLSLIDSFYFSSDDVNKDDVVLNVAIEHSIEKKYDSTTLNTIFISLLNSIIAARIDEGEFAITNPSAKKEREEAEKLFCEGKLMSAYPKFIHAADSGDARACYFAACYYFDAYGITEKNDEQYRKYIDLGVSRRDPLCYLENSRYLYNHGDKTKAEYWRNRILPQVGKLADKGDIVACHLISHVAFSQFMEEYTLLDAKGDEEWTEDEKKKMSVFSSVYRKYSLKAIEAGYWPAAFSKCFSLEIILDGGDREKNIEKYGWMFENVECASVQSMLGHRYLSLDRMDNKYYKNASACFVKAYKLQKKADLCGYISFFLNAGVIDEAAADGIEKKDIKILYYKGLDSNEPTAIDSLGDLYFSGVGKNHLGMNKASAFEHYERAYEKYDDVGDFPGKRKFDTGKASTAYMIGYMLSKGLGTEQNNTRAFGYFLEAFQNGEKRAIKPLAECYLHGTGVEKNIERYNELIAMSEN